MILLKIVKYKLKHLNKYFMSKEVEVKVKAINPEYIPIYGSDEAAGFDFFANEDVLIQPGETKLVGTGVSVALPKGYEIQIRPRSGKSLKSKLRVANSPGTIDSDYRGEIKIICDNIGTEELIVLRGERIAQGVLQEVPKAKFVQVYHLDTTERNEKGFGSSGG